MEANKLGLLLLICLALCFVGSGSTEADSIQFANIGQFELIDEVDLPECMEGNFMLSRLNGKAVDLAIRVEFTGNRIFIIGCNYLTATYSLSHNFKIIDGFTSTRKFCFNDIDPQIVNAFKDSVRIQPSQQSITFYSAKAKETLTLDVEPSSPVGPVSDNPKPEALPPLNIKEQPAQPLTNSLQEISNNGSQGSLTDLVLLLGNQKIQKAVSQNSDGKIIENQVKSKSTEINKENNVGSGGVIEGQVDLQPIPGKTSKAQSIPLQTDTLFDNKSKPDISLIQSKKPEGSTLPAAPEITNIKGGQIKQNISIVTTTQQKTQIFIKPIKPAISSSVVSTSLSSKNSESTIKGTYDLVLNGLDLTVKGGKYTLGGCNAHTFTYALKTNGEVLYGKPISTRKSCAIDFDHYYLDAFNAIKTILIFGKGFNCVDANGIIVLRFESVGQAIGPSGEGQFKVLFPTVELTIDSSFFRFEACNIYSAAYSAKGGSIKLEKFDSTLRSCDFFDFDVFIVEALGLIDSYEKTNTLLKLKSGTNYLVFGIEKNTTTSGPLQPIEVSTPLFAAVEEKVNEPVVIISGSSSSVVQNNKTVIALPVIKQVSLKGNYRFNVISGKLPSVVVGFDQSYMKFEGCNLIQLPYVAYDDGNFHILEGGSLTHRVCETNSDQKYTLFFKTFRKLQKKQNLINFLQDSKTVATLTTKINQQIDSKLIQGTYSLELSGLDTTIKNGNIIVNGCNIHTIPFSADKNGVVTFGGVSSTKKGCLNNDDNVYVKAIITSKTISEGVEGISFIGADGLVRVQFSQVSFSSLVPASPLEGQYKAQLPSSKFKIVVNQKIFSFEGCNKATLDYSISNDGEITFGKLNSTKKSCQVDYDSVFINAVLQTKFIIVTESIISFLTSQGDILAKSTKFIPPTQLQPPKADSSSSQSQNTQNLPKQITFSAGSYRIDYSKRSGVKSISCSIAGSKITVQGCRSYIISYVAYADGTIKFTPQSQSQRTTRCETNEDNMFLTEFRDTETFTQINKNVNLFDIGKKSNLNFVFSSERQSETKNNYEPQRYSQVSLPLYCRFDSYSSHFGGHESPSSPMDWFGLGSRQYRQVSRDQPRTIAQAAGWDSNSQRDERGSQSGSRTFSSFLGYFNPFNWFGRTSQRQKYEPERPVSQIAKDSSPSVSTQQKTDSTQPVKVEGKYRMSLPKVDLIIGKQSFTFKGCNNHRIPCAFRNNKVYFGKPLSSPFQCASDTALNFIQVLPSFVTYRKTAKGFVFFNQHLQSLFTIELKQATNLGRRIIGDLYEGQYEAELPEYNMQLKQSKLKFQGCRDNAISYDYSSHGFVSFKKRETLQRNKCLTDSDEKVVDYLRSSSKITFNTDKSYSIQDDYGNRLISCRPAPNQKK